TVNQYLTAIRVYFDFLLLTGSVVQNPTFRIQFKKVNTSVKSNVATDYYLANYKLIVEDEELSLKSRVIFILLLKGFSLTRMTAINFYDDYKKETSFTDQEKSILNRYEETLLNDREQTGVNLLFYKHNGVTKSSTGAELIPSRVQLHWNLKEISNKYGVSIKPRNIYRKYCLNFIRENPEKSDEEISVLLKISLATVRRYRDELVKQFSERTANIE
ncbi:hypothetical protein IET11_002408, partial [Enterococcus faecium]|nr:hypothetical protein [Enterococcus faecium]